VMRNCSGVRRDRQASSSSPRAKPLGRPQGEGPAVSVSADAVAGAPAPSGVARLVAEEVEEGSENDADIGQKQRERVS
jgi:hypothetical protein